MLFLVPMTLLAMWTGFYPQAVNAPGDSLEELASAAKTAQQNGQYKIAAEKYSAILKLRPDYTEARFNLGLMLHLAGEYPQAVATFKQVLQKDPDSFPSNLMVGVELLKLQQASQAIAFLERARKLRPEDEHAMLNLAQAELLAEHFDTAHMKFADLVRKEPANADAWYGLGLSSLGEMRLSIQQLSAYARDSMYAKILLAESYAERGYWKQADGIYTGLLALSEPQCIASALGFMRLREGDSASADGLFQQDLKRGCAAAAALLNSSHTATPRENPSGISGAAGESEGMPEPVWGYETCSRSDSAQSVPPGEHESTPWLYSAVCAAQKQNNDEALELLRRRLAVAPQDSAALYWKIRIDKKLAYSALARVSKLAPDSIQLHLLIGHILLDEQKLDAAEVEYRQAIRSDPSAMEAHMGLAMAEYQSRDFANAVPELRRILSLAPDDSKANYLLGSILVSQQQYGDAKTYLIQAKKGASGNDVITIRSRLAQAYGETGDLNRAIAELKPCLSADPDGQYHYRISLLYRKSGNTRAAEAALRRSSELRKSSAAATIKTDVQ